MAEGTETAQSNLSSNVFLEQFYSTEYFSNLRDNFGYNDFGTCGHIAIEMVLTYYDTYWDDGVVPDNFEYCDSFSCELNEENEPIIKGGQMGLPTFRRKNGGYEHTAWHAILSDEDGCQLAIIFFPVEDEKWENAEFRWDGRDLKSGKTVFVRVDAQSDENFEEIKTEVFDRTIESLG